MKIFSENTNKKYGVDKLQYKAISGNRCQFFKLLLQSPETNSQIAVFLIFYFGESFLFKYHIRWFGEKKHMKDNQRGKGTCVVSRGSVFASALTWLRHGAQALLDKGHRHHQPRQPARTLQLFALEAPGGGAQVEETGCEVVLTRI